MRRGHLGSGGWRTENPRPFRPRNPGIPHFRPSRSYNLQNINRFPPPGQRLHRPPHFENFANRDDEHYSNTDRYDRSMHRTNNSPVQNRKRGHYHDRGGQRQILPYLQQIRPTENQAPDATYYDNHKSQPYLINNMGDVDHRHVSNNSHNQEGFMNRSTWTDSHYDHKTYQNKSPQKPYMRNNEHFENRTSQNYPGHRPPASDHYSTPPDLENTNNDMSFSRSIDDTVDIVRKRLLNRSEPQSPSSDLNENHLNTGSTSSSQYENCQQEQQPKRRIQRQRQIVKADCDKMKTNIVQQLFKMDKDKIHKLMDNPNSSTKFEYAINSFITESQNSLNRHMRSLAEKSLGSSSDEFIHNDNNTIYEDTFMKQMQCILDPQDTVLLEDIKPLVLAELSKILHLNDVDQMYEIAETHEELYSTEHVDYDYRNENLYYDDYTQESYPNHDEIDSYKKSRFDEHEDVKHSYEETMLYRRRSTDNRKNAEQKYDENRQMSPETKPYFDTYKEHSDEVRYNEHEMNNSFESELSERDLCRRRDSDRRKSTENRRSEDKQLEIKPLFENNTDRISDDEDPFDELDRQYHVPVDHTFLENEECVNMQSSTPPLKTGNNLVSVKTEKTSGGVTHNSTSKDHNTKSNECATKIRNSSDQSHPEIKKEKGSERERKYSEPTIVEKRSSEKEYSSEKTSISSSSRKRSIDQRPSHRKEKRKKSDPDMDSSENKSTSSNASKNTTRKNENSSNTPRSLFDLFLPKTDNNKQAAKHSKRSESRDKEYSNKYVKRKDNIKKDKNTTPTKKHNHSHTSHSTVCKDNYTSPRDNDSTSNAHQNALKTDAKIKLKTIDMFMEQPKKTNLHQSHRNTSISNDKNNIVQKKSPTKQISTDNKDVLKKLISTETQTSNKGIFHTRYSQTEKKKMVTKSVQTDPVTFQKDSTKSTDVFERMKEIDLEIQVLLQEKFKLYNSFESNKTCPTTDQTLGMAVLNVVPVNKVDEKESSEITEETAITEDSIVDDFTNIPVEELAEIALETVEETESTEKRQSRRHSQKSVDNDISSLAPVKKSQRRGKPLNISLLEQIITDDRPLEDIIVLDELEKTPHKKTSKKKSHKKHFKSKKSRKKSKSNQSKETIHNLPQHNIKECSVVLEPIDIRQYFEILGDPSETVETKSDSVSPKSIIAEEIIESQDIPTLGLEVHTEVIEETVVNDIHFDMLDVSEDIVIGDSCEIKSRDSDRLDVPINEEIILDNSQSSCENLVAEATHNEPECKTYDYSTDESLRRDAITVTGNADAVLAIECIENNFIAACLDGNVYHFNCDGQLLNTLKGSNLAVTCITIVKEKYGTTIYTGSLDSRIRYYDLETGVEKGPECNVLSPIQTMDRAWDTIFVGTRTGFVLQFECKNNMLIPVSTVKFSEQSILALRAMKEGPRKVLLVAARSENVTIKDAQTGLLLRSLVGPKMTVYTLLFEDGKVYCGTSSHQIHVFDYTSGSHVGSHEGGKGAVCLRATGGLVFAGCYDGCVYIYREGETKPLAQLRGPSLMLLSLAIVGTKIIAGYKDRGLYIWKIPLNILKEMIL